MKITMIMKKNLTMQKVIFTLRFKLEYLITQNIKIEEYGYGTAAVVIISLISLVGVVLLPCFKKSFYESILIALSALACSTLLADTMLHLLPTIFGLGHNHLNQDDHDHDHDHDHEHDHNHDEPITVPNHVVFTCVAIASIYVAWILNIVIGKLTGGHTHVSIHLLN